MSIMSDRWIRNQCITPTHKVKSPTGGIEYLGHKISDVEKHQISVQEMLSAGGDASFFNEEVAVPPTGQLSDVSMTAAEMGIDVYTKLTEEELANWKPMIEPFVPGQVREENGKKILSYGTSSFGYDVRLQPKFKIFTNINNSLIDPLNVSDDCYVDFEGDSVIIPPNSYALAPTVEYFRIPNDVMVVCVGKSTMARLAGLVNVTPIEPGFEGQVVIEIANGSPLPLKVYANQGIAQFMFFKGNEPSENPYDKSRKYFGQTGITTARL